MNHEVTTGTRFAALHVRDCRWFFAAVLLAMTADNIEHVISYWVIFQKFHSPALGGFAVVSHWIPYLLLALPMGALADRHDCRIFIQASQALFMLASAAWGVLFVTDTLEVWHAAMILLLHGVAGVVGASAIQLVLHDIVGADELSSAIRLNASSRYLSILLGPAVGAGLMLLLGPAWGLLTNILGYLPLTLLLLRLPYTGHAGHPAPPSPSVRRATVGDAWRLLGEAGCDRRIMTMIVLGGAASLFVGNAFQAQMPGYAHDLGADEAGVWYSVLLAGHAAGAVLGAVLLETSRRLRPSARAAIVCAGAWAVTIGLFPAAPSYGTAVVLLLLAGIFDIVFTSTAQTLVQALAPSALRGRIVGLFNLSVLGLRAGSGITVGVLGAVIGVRWSLTLSAAAVVLTAIGLLLRQVWGPDRETGGTPGRCGMLRSPRQPKTRRATVELKGTIKEVGHVVLKVRDLEKARDFYCGVLGMKLAKFDPQRGMFLRFNDYHHDIAIFKTGPDADLPKQNQVGLVHVALVVDSLDIVRAWYQRCKELGVPIVTTTDHAVTNSLYIKDPEGNVLEIYCERPDYDWRTEGMGFIARPLDLESVPATAS